MNHLLFGIIPFEILAIVFNLALIGGVIYLVYAWITKMISLNKERNELLKEILKKMDKKD